MGFSPEIVKALGKAKFLCSLLGGWEWGRGGGGRSPENPFPVLCKRSPGNSDSPLEVATFQSAAPPGLSFLLSQRTCSCGCGSAWQGEGTGFASPWACARGQRGQGRPACQPPAGGRPRLGPDGLGSAGPEKGLEEGQGLEAELEVGPGPTASALPGPAGLPGPLFGAG